jgi:hypothetical protein
MIIDPRHLMVAAVDQVKPTGPMLIRLYRSPLHVTVFDHGVSRLHTQCVHKAHICPCLWTRDWLCTHQP